MRFISSLYRRAKGVSARRSIETAYAASTTNVASASVSAALPVLLLLLLLFVSVNAPRCASSRAI
jgi:hypothetical protein